jgi:hypothetical protein
MITDRNPINTCYNCGKTFKKQSDLVRHKNRKTPCLIRDITPEQRSNPNRCIFCNKIFSTVGNLNKHHKICKIKNGGMDILDQKTQYEQTIRILQERDKQNIELLSDMSHQLEEMRDHIKNISNNTVNNTKIKGNNNNNNTFNFYNCNTPYTDTLRITQDDLLVENIACKMIELIYFNKDIPANHTIYLPNLREKRLLMFRGNSWDTIIGDAIPGALTPVKNAVYLVGLDKINSIYSTDEEFDRLYPVVKSAIESFNGGKEQARCEDKEIIELFKSKRDLVAPTLREKGII